MRGNNKGATRRRVLVTGVSAGAIALAGCIGGNGDDDGDGEIIDPDEYDYERDEPDDEDAAMESTMVYTQELERDDDFDPVAGVAGLSVIRV